MSLFYIIIIGLILFLGSVLQGAVGFAYSLFAVPLLVWLGIELNQAVTLLSMSILIQVLVGTYQLHRVVPWGDVISATLIRYATIPLGVWLLARLDTFSPAAVKQIVGIILLLVLFVQFMWKIEPQEHLSGGWKALAFSCSGILQGAVAMGGPPTVLWVMAQRWSNQQTRAFLFALFLLAAPFQLTLLYTTFGDKILWAIGSGLLFAPLVIGGGVLGVQLGNFISKPRLRQIAFGLLFFIACSSIVTPLLG